MGTLFAWLGVLIQAYQLVDLALDTALDTAGTCSV